MVFRDWSWKKRHSGSGCFYKIFFCCFWQGYSNQQAMLVAGNHLVGLEQGGIYRWTLRLEHICRSLSNLQRCNLPEQVSQILDIRRCPRCTSTPNAYWSNLAMLLSIDTPIGSWILAVERLQLLLFERNIHHLQKIHPRNLTWSIPKTNPPCFSRVIAMFNLKGPVKTFPRPIILGM